jgi:dynein heavy chain
MYHPYMPSWFILLGTASPGLVQVVEACTTDARLETLQGLSERLDLCQKSLSEYLDAKRNAFPRFFFISDDELLSVLVRQGVLTVVHPSTLV